MKEFLQGAWLQHPLHPLLVHLPTALWPAALLFDVLTNVGLSGNALVQLSFYAILVGLLAALLAVPTGLADWWDIKSSNPAHRLGLYHMILNALVTAVFALNLYLRWNTWQTAESVATLPLILSLIGVLLLSVSGYLGGRMVFEYGISVARPAAVKEKLRDRARGGGANLPPPPEGG